MKRWRSSEPAGLGGFGEATGGAGCRGGAGLTPGVSEWTVDGAGCAGAPVADSVEVDIDAGMNDGRLIRPEFVLRSIPRVDYREAPRAAASFNKSPEPTAVGACSSAVAVHVASRRWLSFFR